jgi:hypothetical protein
LLEDFGDDRVRDWLDERPGDEAAIYEAALAPLVTLGKLPAGPFPPYDMAVYLREVGLLVEWYAPAAGLVVDAAGYVAAWEQVLAPLVERQGAGVTVLRDYHAENIMLLDGSLTTQGLLDFQDALAGHPAYDLVSLLQDARRDVPAATEAAMLDHYLAATGLPREAFLADYALLGAQRNAKIVGIFIRLWQRDGKPRYLSLIPRVWALLERDLKHPALAPVAAWFDANIPAELRQTGGGSFRHEASGKRHRHGSGRRDRQADAPLTATRPKPMVKVLGKPLIDHALDKLATAGINRVVVNTHYLGDHLAAHLSHRKTPRSPFRTSVTPCWRPAAGWCVRTAMACCPTRSLRSTATTSGSTARAMCSPNSAMPGMMRGWMRWFWWCAIPVPIIIRAWAISSRPAGPGQPPPSWPRGALYLHRHPARLAPSAA